MFKDLLGFIIKSEFDLIKFKMQPDKLIQYQMVYYLTIVHIALKLLQEVKVIVIKDFNFYYNEVNLRANVMPIKNRLLLVQVLSGRVLNQPSSTHFLHSSYYMI